MNSTAAAGAAVGGGVGGWIGSKVCKAGDDSNHDDCREQWISDTKWCDNNFKGRKNIACHAWAQENFLRCLNKLPRQPFKLYGNTMELSDNQNYVDYMNLFVDRRYGPAVEALAKCLQEFRGDKIKESFLLKLMADAYFSDGKIEKSFEYYSMSEMADTDSLQPKLFFAEFLAKKIKDYDGAIRKCNEILRLAESNPVDETDEDFGSYYYVSKAGEISFFCQQQIANKEGEI